MTEPPAVVARRPTDAQPFASWCPDDDFTDPHPRDLARRSRARRVQRGRRQREPGAIRFGEPGRNHVSDRPRRPRHPAALRRWVCATVRAHARPPGDQHLRRRHGARARAPFPRSTRARPCNPSSRRRSRRPGCRSSSRPRATPVSSVPTPTTTWAGSWTPPRPSSPSTPTAASTRSRRTRCSNPAVGSRMNPGADPAVTEARAKLLVFQNQLANLEALLGPEVGDATPYVPTALQLLVTDGAPVDEQALGQEPIAWPLDSPLADVWRDDAVPDHGRALWRRLGRRRGPAAAAVPAGQHADPVDRRRRASSVSPSGRCCPARPAAQRLRCTRAHARDVHAAILRRCRTCRSPGSRSSPKARWRATSCRSSMMPTTSMTRSWHGSPAGSSSRRPRSSSGPAIPRQRTGTGSTRWRASCRSPAIPRLARPRHMPIGSARQRPRSSRRPRRATSASTSSWTASSVA